MADLLGLFNAAANLSNNITGDIIKKQEENAALRAKTTMQDYVIKQQEFLQDLQTNPDTAIDFENWGKYATEFQEKYKNEVLNNKTKPVNNLTAKYISQSLDASYPSLLMKVKDQAFEGMNKSYFAESMKSIKQIRDLKTGQEGYEENWNTLDDLYSKGQLNDAEFFKYQSNELRYWTYGNMQETVTGVAENAVASGKSIDECINEARKNISNYTPIKYKNTDEPLNNDEIKEMESSIIDGVQKQYNNALQTLQKDNDAYLSTFYDKMLQNPQNANINARQGMKALNAILDNNKNSLSTEQKVKWETRFKVKEDEEYITGGSSRTSTKTFNAQSEADQLSKGLIASAKIGEYNLIAQGLSTGQDAMIYYKNTLVELAKKSGMNETDTDLFVNKNFSNFRETMVKEYKDLPFVKEMITKINNKVDQWNKKGTFKKDEMQQEALAFLYDQVTSLDPSNHNQMETALKNTEAYMTALYSKNVADELKGKAESQKFIKSHTNKDGTLKIESLANGMYDLQLVKEKEKNPDAKIFYTNAYGDNVISQSATDIINGVIDPGAKQAIAAITNGNAETMKGNWQRTDNFDDLTGNRIYQDEKGSLYVFISTGKKTYDVMKKEGKDFVKIGDNKTVEKALKEKANSELEKNKLEKAETKANKKQAFKNINELTDNQRKYLVEKTEELAKSDTSPFPQWSDNEWKAMTKDLRMLELQRDTNIVSNIMTSYK